MILPVGVEVGVEVGVAKTNHQKVTIFCLSISIPVGAAVGVEVGVAKRKTMVEVD